MHSRAGRLLLSLALLTACGDEQVVRALPTPTVEIVRLLVEGEERAHVNPRENVILIWRTDVAGSFVVTAAQSGRERRLDAGSVEPGLPHGSAFTAHDLFEGDNQLTVTVVATEGGKQGSATTFATLAGNPCDTPEDCPPCFDCIEHFCSSLCIPGALCDHGECRCKDGETDCGGVCVDLSSDVNHCGGCFLRCTAPDRCFGGECRRCPEGETFCTPPGMCVDTRSDPEHCGACGRVCAPTQACRNGSCACPPGQEREPAQNPCEWKDDLCDGIPPPEMQDRDRDGFTWCQGDCDDADPTVHPGAPELCDAKDTACTGTIPMNERDLDGDRHIGCGPLAPTARPGVLSGRDCDDNDATVYPGASELCDGKDNACVGMLPTIEWDLDGDKHLVCGPLAATARSGLLGGFDCNDADATVYPSAPELCDGKDNACQGVVPLIERDLDGDRYLLCGPLASTALTNLLGGLDCDDLDPTVHPGAPQLCDGKANHCGSLPLGERDADSDRYLTCGPLAPTARAGLSGGNDCDDNDSTLYPGAPELCDGKDNACTGAIAGNERDLDNDGYLVCGPLAATAKPGIVGGFDCDDNDPTVYPGAPELCDGKANGCGALPDNERDLDGDKYLACGPLAPTARPGLLGGGDCNDNRADVYPGAPDKPDLEFVDNNCDGIDGDKNRAVFVSTAGNDTNAGTFTAPKRSVTAAILAAATASPKKDVYVARGTYGEAITLQSGVSIYGGYDASSGWTRNASNPTTLASPTTVGVTASELTQQTELQLLTITSADATGTAANGDGRSAYGILALNSSGGLVVRGCTVTAGRGSAGSPGSHGSTGAAGSRGRDASGTTAGSGGGATICGTGGDAGAAGGAGGAGVSGTTSGNPGVRGSDATNGGAGGPRGEGGAAGTCTLTSSSNGQNAPPVASGGQAGAPGANGTLAAAFGSFDASGNYIPPAGHPGLIGRPGGGGGGGGSGGGTASGTDLFCTDCSSISSGAGGGGGGGGCGGTPGSGGRGGGGSFAIVSLNSSVTVLSSKLDARQGGAGGNGGNGGLGGDGGAGGAGAPGAMRDNHCSTRSGGNGAAGAAGGAGGRGGGGSGGAGGPSICIVYRGTAPTTANNSCTHGVGGAGGTGGTNGLQSAASGPRGIEQPIFQAP